MFLFKQRQPLEHEDSVEGSGSGHPSDAINSIETKDPGEGELLGCTN